MKYTSFYNNYLIQKLGVIFWRTIIIRTCFCVVLECTFYSKKKNIGMCGRTCKELKEIKKKFHPYHRFHIMNLDKVFRWILKLLTIAILNMLYNFFTHTFLVIMLWYYWFFVKHLINGMPTLNTFLNKLSHTIKFLTTFN